MPTPEHHTEPFSDDTAFWLAAQCDDACGRPGTLVVVDLASRDVGRLCWPCLMRHALEIAGAVAGEAGDAAA